MPPARTEAALEHSDVADTNSLRACQHESEGFTVLISLNPYNNPMEYVVLFPISDKNLETEGVEVICHLPQFLSGRVSI